MSRFPRPVAGAGAWHAEGLLQMLADRPPRGAQDDLVFAPPTNLDSCGSTSCSRAISTNFVIDIICPAEDISASRRVINPLRHYQYPLP